MDAEVTIKIKFRNVCNKEDLDDITFEEMVKYLIKEEGILGIISADDEPEILKIEEC